MNFFKFLYCMVLCVLFCSCCEMNKQDTAQVLQPDTNMVSNEKDSAKALEFCEKGMAVKRGNFNKSLYEQIKKSRK